MPLLNHVLLLLLIHLHAVAPASRVRRIVGGEEADIPPEDDPVVVLYTEGHDARVVGVRESPTRFYAFRGIKYAHAPTGRFRFQRARRLRLDGDVNATVNAPPCPQRRPHGGQEVIGDEDCLALNVFTPRLSAGDDVLLPVLVWIHGGGWRSGSAAQYGARHLVDKKLVVVVIQYRLGSLGFLSTGSKQLPGNVGLCDMRLALDWVREYIGYFGGDSAKVTVSGQDTGAVSAQLLAMAPLSRGLVGGVIALGGSALSSIAVDVDPLGTSRDLAARSGCAITPVLAMLRCLQALSAEQVVSADSALTSVKLVAAGAVGGLASLLGAGPAVEGSDDKRFLPHVIEQPPSYQLEHGAFPAIPMLAGVTKNPTSTALLGGLRTEVERQIRTVPQFVERVMGGLVAATAGLVANRSQELTSQLTAGYFRLPGRQQATDVAAAIKQLAEATADALFNLPAIQVASLWSKRAPAYFFSFDHEGKQKGGPLFLQDSPLTDGAQQNTGVGHGDELLYMFEPQPLEGGTVDQYAGLDDAIDVRVRDTVTTVVASFATTGKPALPASDGGSWPSFSTGSTSYVSLSAESRTEQSFRQCEMSLWTGAAQSAACRLVDGVGGLLNVPKSVVGQSANVLSQPLSGVVGRPTNQDAAQVKPTNNKPAQPARAITTTKATPKPRFNIGGINLGG